MTNDCLPCIVRGSLDAAKLATDDTMLQQQVVKRILNRLPLPARPLRTCQPDRLLPASTQAALKAPDPRRQRQLFQEAPVHAGLAGTLWRPGRVARGIRWRGKDMGDYAG